MDTKKLRQKILDLAIRGKLVPQDSNDEPASVLLERIKAEKERLIKEGKIKRSKKSAKTSDTPHYENVLPKGWVWTILPELCIIPITDGTHQTPTYTDKEHGIPFISSKDVTSQRINWDNVKYITKELHEELYRRIAPQKDDILLAKNGTTGVAAIVEDSRVFDIYVTLAVIRPSQNIYPRYLYQVINSNFCKEQFNNHLTGIGLPNLHLVDIKKTIIPLPPFAEQQRIVAEIEKWFALIDQIEQEKSDLQTIIKQTKSKILDLAIHGKLVPQDPNDEPAIELLKRINPNFTPCDNGHYTQLPEGWQIAPMQTLCKLTDGEKQTGIERIYLDVKYLRGEREAKTMISGKFVAANALLILVDGENSGEVFQTPIDGYQGSTFKQLLINGNMNEEYVLLVINMHRKILRESKVGSAIPHLNKKLFKAIEVPIPPYHQQKRIVEAINIMFKHLDIIMESL